MQNYNKSPIYMNDMILFIHILNHIENHLDL